MQRLLRALPREMAGLSWAARKAFERAVDAALRGQRFASQTALAEALGHDPEVPAGRLLAAQIRYALRQYQAALHELDAATTLGAGPHADELRWGFTARLGWNHEAREVIERRLGASNSKLWRGRAVQLFGVLRHHAAALEHVEQLIATSAPSSTLELNAAHLATRTGAHQRTREHVQAAIALDPGRASLRTASAVLLAAAGFADEAFDQVRQAIELAPTTAAHAVCAELSLWIGDCSAALLHAEHCEPSDRLRIRGAVAVLAGAHAAALRDLEGALRLDPENVEAHVWRAEALLRLERFEAATEAVDRGIARADGHLFAAQLIRLLATLRSESQLKDRLTAASFSEIRAACAEIAPASTKVFESGERAAVIEQLEAALRLMGGNRSDRSTWLDGKRLRPVEAREGARFASRAALDLINIEPLPVVLSALDGIAHRYPESSLPLAHRGEAQLWMGNYEAARIDLERALSINPFTRWAYIGLTALELLAGRPEEALAVSARGVERMGSAGPAVYVHRGEAYRRLGEYDRAIEDLETARQLNPSRLAATINLALALRAKGHADRAEALFQELIGRAPGLLSDAAIDAGVEDWERTEPGAQPRLLEVALDLMRGNRSSSCHTYVTRGGVVRTAPTGLDIRAELDQRDTDALRSAAAWLQERRTEVEHAGQTSAADARRDVELVALVAGLRTAVRASVEPDRVQAARRRYAAAGMASIVGNELHAYGGESLAIVYVGRTETDARRALQAEEALDAEELGRLLGYPVCCIEEFARRSKPRDQYEAARAAWVPRPLPRLNTLCFGIGARFISFEPCRFDCAAAAAVADAIADALAMVSPESRAWCDTALSRSVAIDASDARARVTLDGAQRVIGAEPIASIPGRPIGSAAIELARRVVGARLEEGGRVDGAAGVETLVVDFGWPSRRL